MSSVAAIVHTLAVELRQGNISLESAQHLRHELWRAGREVSQAVVGALFEDEAARLEREAAVLRRLKNTAVDTGGDRAAAQ
jgi:hypothetical protein